jgi:hypothetical protein
VCFYGNEDENRKHLFIGVYGCCGPQKLSGKRIQISEIL